MYEYQVLTYLRTKTLDVEDTEQMKAYKESYEGCPFDKEFWTNKSFGSKFKNQLPLVKATENLYVTKPIGKFKPVVHFEPGFFQPDITKIHPKKFPSQSRNANIQ